VELMNEEQQTKIQSAIQPMFIPGYIPICANCPFKDYYIISKTLQTSIAQIKQQQLELAKLNEEIEILKDVQIESTNIESAKIE